MSKKVIVSTIIVILVVIMAFTQSFAKGDDITVNHIRKYLLERVDEQQKKLSLPSHVVSEYVAIIRDDRTPIDSSIVTSLFEKPPTNQEERARRLAYVTALLFRERETPLTVQKLYDHFTSEEKITILALLTSPFKPFVNQTYFDLAREGFDDAVQKAEQRRGEKQQDGQAEADDLCMTWIDLLALTRHPDASKAILHAIKYQVINSDFRFTIVGRAMSRLRADAVPIAQWYFESYAWRPFEVQTIATYLAKYGEPAANRGLFAAKMDSLRQGQQSLRKLGAVTIDQLARPSTTQSTE